MDRYTLVVFSRPVPGREDEYNDWYTNQHIEDVMKLPGAKSARRLSLAVNLDGDLQEYCALYEVESDDPSDFLEQLQSRAGSDQMPLTDAMGAEMRVAFYKEFASVIA